MGGKQAIADSAGAGHHAVAAPTGLFGAKFRRWLALMKKICSHRCGSGRIFLPTEAGGFACLQPKLHDDRANGNQNGTTPLQQGTIGNNSGTNGEPEADIFQMSQPNKPGYIKTIAHQRCPKCRKGIVFRHGMEMNNKCPYCGARFDREPGFFTGAMHLGTIIALPVALLLMFVLMVVLPDVHPALHGLLAMIGVLPIIPLTVRLSRVLWLDLGAHLTPQDPDDDPPPPPSAPDPDPPTAPSAPKGENSPIAAAGSRLQRERVDS